MQCQRTALASLLIPCMRRAQCPPVSRCRARYDVQADRRPSLLDTLRQFPIALSERNPGLRRFRFFSALSGPCIIQRRAEYPTARSFLLSKFFFLVSLFSLSQHPACDARCRAPQEGGPSSPAVLMMSSDMLQLSHTCCLPVSHFPRRRSSGRTAGVPRDQGHTWCFLGLQCSTESAGCPPLLTGRPPQLRWLRCSRLPGSALCQRLLFRK
ncbi:hypothetical protein NDU88_012064 [Pleurodeles waltl]|uniref:Secreted protein n=1 Tax=Pleurodeles waltl TaxID=8319 RepID=A0AAV7R2V7_PLEWA|nr:hypothetical protein NDU88_012064 [Pleurodeles waltl]